MEKIEKYHFMQVCELIFNSIEIINVSNDYKIAI